MDWSEKNLLLYAVTDRSSLNGATLTERVRQALNGGITMLQLREKTFSEPEFLEEAVEMRALCAEYHVPLIINDNVEIAVRAGADGVHLGQDDMDVPSARAVLGPDKIIGVSARTAGQALLAQEQGADYLGVGAVFATATKKDAKPVSLSLLSGICRAVSIPVVAIGGITQENVPGLSGTGISGIAVAGAIFAQPDAQRAAWGLLRKAELVAEDGGPGAGGCSGADAAEDDGPGAGGCGGADAAEDDGPDAGGCGRPVGPGAQWDGIFCRDVRDRLRTAAGVIFDADGTILDSMSVWENAGSRYLESLGIRAEAGLSARMSSMTMRQGADYLKQTYQITGQSRSEIIEGINGTVRQYYDTQACLKPGMGRLLNWLSRRQIPAAVLTATDRPLILSAFKRLGIVHHFEFILTCSEYGSGKDTPELFLEAARRLVPAGADVSSVWVAEDSLYAAKAAKAAGFPVIGVWDASGASGEPEFRRIADCYIGKAGSGVQQPRK